MNKGKRMNWITADLHLGHANIIKYCNRPFTSVQEMDSVLIGNINKVVMPGDALWIVGDFSMSSNYDVVYKYRERINCQNIHLILGNHDYLAENQYNHIFESVSSYQELMYNTTKVVLSHYAMRVWNKSHRGAWHLYGHSHGALPDNGDKSFDVGVDCWNYKPLSITDIEKEMSTRTFKPVDNHKER